MNFGTGPLKGWTITPGPAEEREQTARGAFLQALLLMTAEPTPANRLKLFRLLDWAPSEREPRLAFAMAEAFTNLHADLELETRKAPEPKRDFSKITPGELADGFEQLERRGPQETSDASISPDALARELGRPPQGALPPKPATCGACAEPLVDGEPTVIESNGPEWTIERHAVCPADRTQRELTREELLSREFVGEHAMAAIFEKSKNCRPTKERPKKERVTCELCVQPIEVGELSRARGKGSSRRMHEACRAEALEIHEARALEAEQAVEREIEAEQAAERDTDPETLYGAPPRSAGETA